MHSIKTSFILGLMMLPLMLAGQQTPDRLVITGRIIDRSTGRPLIAANVLIEALDAGSASDDSGYFRIDIPIVRYRGKQVELSVRYIGYSTVTLPVLVATGTTSLNFFLAPTVVPFDQTTVMAPRPKISRGTASQIFSGDELRATGRSNAFDALKGKIPGFIASGGNGIGSSARFTTRGTNFFRSNVAAEYPLIVIDGTPLNNTLGPGGFAEILLDINVADIETVEVVRGPGALWRYGPNAAKGAIIITTRRGAR